MARISTSRSGTNKQDYATPIEFMKAVERRFGPIAFDLAATASNTKSSRYFAPATGPEGPMPFDPNAYAIDSFDHSWSELSQRQFPRDDGSPGLLWLNPPFAEIPAWAARCRNESLLGASIVMLVPAAVGSVWFDELVAGHSDVYFVKPRIAFIAGESYNKDCMLVRFFSSPVRTMNVWDWRTDRISHMWTGASP